MIDSQSFFCNPILKLEVKKLELRIEIIRKKNVYVDIFIVIYSNVF